MSIAPISNDNIKVGYISEDDGYVKGVSIAQANAYEALNPDTTFIFLNGDNKVEYLSIDEVNRLTPKNSSVGGGHGCGPTLHGSDLNKFFDVN